MPLFLFFDNAESVVRRTLSFHTLARVSQDIGTYTGRECRYHAASVVRSRLEICRTF